MPESSKETDSSSLRMDASGTSSSEILRVFRPVFRKWIIVVKPLSPDAGKGDDRNRGAAIRAVARIDVNFFICS